MALKLLNPGLRPLGMFDLADADADTINGGEYVQLSASDSTGAGEGYAADVGAMTDNTDNSVMFTLTAGRDENTLGGLADEGGDEYGTLFGSLIGQNAGRSTQFGTLNGAVVVGPNTDAASGKVTVWATAGLYGVTDQDSSLDTADANDNIIAGTGGLLETSTDTTGLVATYVAAMSDSSLVSTTNAAAGEAADTEYHAIFYLGNVATSA